MRSLDEIEEQLQDAYERQPLGHYRALSNEELKLRQEELQMMLLMLSDHLGSEAKEAMSTISYELYDIDDELQERH